MDFFLKDRFLELLFWSIPQKAVEPDSIVLRFLLRRKAPDKDSKADKNQYWTCPQISRGDAVKFVQQVSFAVRSDHERTAAIALLQGDGRV